MLLQMVFERMRSPTEFESTPVVAHLMQEFFLQLFGKYRKFVSIEAVEVPVAEASPRGPKLGRTASGGHALGHGEDDGILRSAWDC